MTINRVSPSGSLRSDRLSDHARQQSASTSEAKSKFEWVSQADIASASPVYEKQLSTQDLAIDDWVDKIVDKLTESQT